MEVVSPEKGRHCAQFYTPLWRADNQKIQRMAPTDFIGRYLNSFFDHGIADEVREFKGQTAQGNALGTLASACERTIILTGTLLQWLR
jgi:hypothetical protein